MNRKNHPVQLKPLLLWGLGQNWHKLCLLARFFLAFDQIQIHSDCNTTIVPLVLLYSNSCCSFAPVPYQKLRARIHPFSWHQIYQGKIKKKKNCWENIKTLRTVLVIKQPLGISYFLQTLIYILMQIQTYISYKQGNIQQKDILTVT